VNPPGFKNFRALTASMTPITWARAVVIFMVLVACALVILAIVLAVVLWPILAAIHAFGRLGINGVLVAMVWWYVAGPWI
jgi:endonuclease/exonuclease/phosphatase (EEP) superfamily protein YafD